MKLDQLQAFKQSAEKITCLTAYDASFSQLFDECGVDIILVGDSLGRWRKYAWRYHGRYDLSYSISGKRH